MFLAEADYIIKYVNSDYTMDVSKIGVSALDTEYKYTVDAATDTRNGQLKGVSFHVYPKQTVAFVGSTGSGKSTILSLICRNYDIQKGQILIDGVDIKHIKISSLRRHFGQMLQDVFLFAGDIRSNIVLRSDNVSDEEVWQACRYVNADSFIKKLEGGLNETVREQGNNFSAGQRQLRKDHPAQALRDDPR